MTLDEIKQRLVEEIRARGRDDKYIDTNEEREILQIAIHRGIEINQALAALAEVCVSEGFTQENDLRSRTRELCRAAIEKDGFIQRSMFEQIFRSVLTAAQGRVLEKDVKKLIVTVMEDHALNKVKSGWFVNWYSSVKRDVGLA
ncbi:MAG: hypothetical protein EXS09_18850 [Gemmataceae bacterium]|nr:hypothetical protein [Gemmataceae bacterium]